MSVIGFYLRNALLFGLLLVLNSCSKTEFETTSDLRPKLIKKYFKGELKSVIYYHYINDKIFQVETVPVDSNSYISHSKNSYKYNGNTITIFRKYFGEGIWKDGYTTKIEFKNRKWSSFFVYDSEDDNNFKLIKHYEFDGNKLVSVEVEDRLFSPDGYINRKIYAYNSGRKEKYSFFTYNGYDNEWSPQSHTFYSYGNEISESTTISHEEQELKNRVILNEKDTIKHVKIYDLGQDDNYYLRYENFYHYNKDGYLIERFNNNYKFIHEYEPGSCNLQEFYDPEIDFFEIRDLSLFTPEFWAYKIDLD